MVVKSIGFTPWCPFFYEGEVNEDVGQGKQKKTRQDQMDGPFINPAHRPPAPHDGVLPSPPPSAVPMNQAFNACIRDLPKRLRVKTMGKTFVRYERFPGEDLFSSCPYRKPRKRMVRTDYTVAFGNHRIRLEEVAYDVVLFEPIIS